MRINAKEDRRFKATALALNAAKQSVKTSNSKEKVLELAVDKAENLSKEITNTKQEDVAKNAAKQPKKTAEFTPRM